MKRPIVKKLVTLLYAASLFITLGCTSQPLPDKDVMILMPKANEVVKAGELYEILWTTGLADSEFGASVTIEFSKDGGQSWEVVEQNVPNSWKYVWKIPKVHSARCKVRIFSQSQPTHRGTSEVFSVK
jgi:hypothetical protein